MRFIVWFCFMCALAAQTAPNWTEVFPQTNPPPRNDHFLVYDAARGQVVLFGGAEHPDSNDTWVWNGTDWTQKSPQTSPSARDSYGIAFDSAHNQVVMFGGANGNGPSLNDTWTWDGANWTMQSPQTSPPARTRHAMAYDAMHGQVVMFGGLDATNLNNLNDTWVWDGSNWTRKSPQNSPTPRKGHRMVYDSARGQIVLFGGRAPGANLADTWVWDGSNWTEKLPQTLPPARSFFGLAEDSARAEVVMFAGNGASGNLDDTWIWNGNEWIQRFPQTSPSARNDDSMAYDSMHDQVVMFGGGPLKWVWQGGAIPPIVTAVVNGASFVGGGLVPGEIATAFGTNLTSAMGINLTSSLPLPMMFLNDSLMVNGTAVPLFAIDNVNGQQQFNFQVPWEVAGGPNVTVAVVNNGSTSTSIQVPVLAAQPGIFTYSVGGNTFGAILHASFQLADTGHPAKPGETVLIYCTGLGAVSSPPASGEPGNGQTSMTMPTVTIGGTNAMVSFSGLAPGFVGLYQINVEVPTGLAPGNQPVIVSMSGTSSNEALLPVS